MTIRKAWASCYSISSVSMVTKSTMRKKRYQYVKANGYRERRRGGILAVARRKVSIASV